MEHQWLFSFAVKTQQPPSRQFFDKNFTTYKITSIIIPKNAPEALSCITVIKRFREIITLYKDICRKAREAKINPALVPELKSTTYFKRFSTEVIEQRKEYITTLLNFIGDHPVLFRSEPFVKFFNTSQISKETNDTDQSSESHSSDTLPTDDLMKRNDDDTISIQSNNLEAYLETTETQVSKDALDQITNKIFPHVTTTNPETDILIDQLTEEIALDQKLEDARIESIERRLNLLVNDNSFDYLYEAALRFTEAVEAEATCFYQKAFDSYKAGIDLLLSGVKNDMDVARKKIVREKVTKYLEKAEEIYENFILTENNDDALVSLSTKNAEKSFEEITGNIERPLNYLSRFKVLKIVDEQLQQVQDVTDKKVYMMKVIQKPHSLQASRMICLPEESRFMVPLVTYCQTTTSIFLILKLISGGKLWDYIKNYQNINSPMSINESGDFKTIFAEPPTKESPVHHLLSQISKELSHKDAEKNSEVEISFPSIPSTPDPETKASIVSYENLSPQMEVHDLLDCSQKLLNSISNRLSQFKDADKAIDATSPENVDSDLDSEIDEGSIGEILKEILEADNMDHRDKCTEDEFEEIKSKSSANMNTSLLGSNFHTQTPKCASPFTIPYVPKVRLLPTSTVRQYCAELVCAIDDLHSHGIICGDLSLNNILLGDKGQLLLTYFYRNETRLMCPSEKAIQCFYVAPERPLTKISDSWSLGIIMFELLTEQRFYELHPGSLNFYAELQFNSVEITEDAQDLLRHLIEFDPTKRLTISKVKDHNFFKLVDWVSVKEKGKIK